MAVNYTNLFTGVGELVQRTTEYVAIYSTLTSGLSEIETDLESIGRGDIFSGMPDIFDGFRNSILGWIGQINSKANDLLTERQSVLEELHLNTTDIQGVMAEMIRDMNDNLKTVKANSVTIGAITEDKVNAGAGGLMIDKKLDGVSPPHQTFAANWEYNNVDSELAETEDMFVQCLADSHSDGQAEGSEGFQVFGQVPVADRFSWESFGSGAGPSLTPIQGGSILVNMEMEGFTNDIPDGWTLDAGTAATNVTNSTATFHRGEESLRLIGDAATATIQISQALPISIVQPRKRYVVGFWIKGQAGTSAGTLTIQLEGTGYTAGVSEKISLNSATLAAMGGSFSWQYFYVTMPDSIPDDMELVIKWTGTPSAHSVYIDGGGMAAPVWHNGVNFAMYAGSSEFIKNDRWTFAITQNDAGVFQKWFRKALGVQLPSSGAPTISDSLAS